MKPSFHHQSRAAFSLVEVILAVGIVSFSVLVTFALLSVANDTNAKARQEAFAAQIAANEFERIRGLGVANFPTTYTPRYYDSDLRDLGQAKTAAAAYQFKLTLTDDPVGTADKLLNAEVRYPAQADDTAQTVVRFTTYMESPQS